MLVSLVLYCRPRGVETGTNSTPTTLVIVNAMNSTQKTEWAIDLGDGVSHNLTVALGPHTVHFAPL
jgi:ABC-type tungstate transport system permease subunit